MENNKEQIFKELLDKQSDIVKRFMENDNKKEKHYHGGHRKRLDKKALENFDALAPHEYLEILLFNVIPRANTNELAHELIDKFGSLKGVLNADINELTAVKGIGYRTAMFLSLQNRFAGLVTRCQLDYKVLDTAEKIRKYITTFFIGRETECAYVFMLDSRNGLKGVKFLSDGITDETYIYADKVCDLALSLKAKKVIVAHNHPSGVVEASDGDISVSKELEIKLNRLNIKLADSVIVSDEDYFSLRANGYLESKLIWGS